MSKHRQNGRSIKFGKNKHRPKHKCAICKQEKPLKKLSSAKINGYWKKVCNNCK